MAAASTLAVPRASDPARAGSLTRMALAAPMASAVRRPLVSLLGAIDTRVTSPPPACSASCRPISTPKESDSSRMSLPSRTSVLVLGIELRRGRRVGDLLDTDDDVHSLIVLETLPVGANLPRPGSGRWLWSPGLVARC